MARFATPHRRFAAQSLLKDRRRRDPQLLNGLTPIPLVLFRVFQMEELRAVGDMVVVEVRQSYDVESFAVGCVQLSIQCRFKVDAGIVLVLGLAPVAVVE